MQNEADEDSAASWVPIGENYAQNFYLFFIFSLKKVETLKLNKVESTKVDVCTKDRQRF